MSELDRSEPESISMIRTAVIPEKGYFKMRFQNLTVLGDKTWLFAATGDSRQTFQEPFRRLFVEG